MPYPTSYDNGVESLPTKSLTIPGDDLGKCHRMS